MKKHLVGGFAAGLLAASSWTAVAQDASRTPPGCSGFMCRIFGSKLDDAPAPSPAPPPVRAATPAKAPVPKVAKVLPAVTIAADGAEAARLKVLAATLPKTRVHIVPPGAKATPDFVVAAAVDRPASREKARLFTEQLHVIAGADVRSPADLKGKVVSFGPDGSAAQTAARKAFAALGVTVTEAPLDLDNALDGLATGDVAAAVVLAPQPDARLARLGTGGTLHLVSWPADAALPEGAAASAIEGSAYPGLAKAGERVRAPGFEASLDASGKGAAGPAAKAFLAALSQHAGTLSKRGFDLLQADADARGTRRVASIERR